VIETGLSLVVLAEPIPFGNSANDPVRLVIGLCAVDHHGHLDVMQELAIALSDAEYVNSLLNAVNAEHLRSLF
jgi:mannitol/fructose-specific phosphotransferase system IIA component (Ntr-type)